MDKKYKSEPEPFPGQIRHRQIFGGGKALPLDLFQLPLRGMDIFSVVIPSYQAQWKSFVGKKYQGRVWVKYA